MSCVRRPYFEDGAETIHFSQRGQIKIDPRSVNQCPIIKEKESERVGGREGDWREKWLKERKGRRETVLETRWKRVKQNR